mmetsp:Transcript_24685/g.38791  ORF Transcript_24685/g.38791 Transcript_24685/m.38791 type:complete len:100 (+) Transcript_24685:71-370(+)
MVADAFSDTIEQGPKATTSTAFFLYSSNCDELYKTVMAHGFSSVHEPRDYFWGDRIAKVRDPFGHCWDLATPLKQSKRTKEELLKGQKIWEDSHRTIEF